MLDDAASQRDLENWRKYRGRLGEDVRSTPVYKLKLNGPIPDKLNIYPQNLRSGNPVLGEQMLEGHWKIGRDRLGVPPEYAPWDQAGPSRHFADRLHRFGWLVHLTAAGPKGQRRARQLVERWISDFGKWNGFVWRIPVTVDRLWNWLTCGPILFDNLPPDSEMMISLVRQGRHLIHSSDDCHEPRVKMRSILVQMAMAFATDETDKRLPQLEGQLDFMLVDHVLADGGHVSRNPEALVELLIDLQTIDDLYLRTGRPSLPFLARIIPRMAGMLKFLRTQDGGLPILNGSSEGNRADIKNALFPYSGSRAFAFATKSGFQKLEAKTARLFLDAGAAPPPEYAIEAHAGCLSFQFEDNGERMITNCGSHPDVDPVWRSATKGTDGHSTLIVTGQDASDFIPLRSVGLDVPAGPMGVSARRMEERDDILIDSQHSGWKDSVGLVFRRRIFMSEAGDRLTGEDSLFRPVSAGETELKEGIPFDVRFHLHPSVSLKRDGQHLKLVLPSGAAWLFKTNHKNRGIDRSVYLARGTVEKCWQLVLSGSASPNGDASTPENIIRWAFTKVA